MSSSTYKLLTKSWEDPEGFVHEGEWREFELVTITKSKRKHTIESGFGHLVNGDWLWVKYPDIERVCYIHLRTIDKIVDMNDNVVELEYDGLNFKLKEKQQ